MFSWSNLFDLQNCGLNNSMVNWLGVEKEGLSTECTYKLELSKLERNSTLKEKAQSSSDFNDKSAK
ncbi:MAG: hypothetical protein AAFQ14_10110 [Cyanobacteria bacterium J06621_12]